MVRRYRWLLIAPVAVLGAAVGAGLLSPRLRLLFSGPIGVAVNGRGAVYVANRSGHCVEVYEPATTP